MSGNYYCQECEDIYTYLGNAPCECEMCGSEEIEVSEKE